MNTLEILFFVLLFIVFYTYVGYGILLWILVKIKQSFISFYDTDEPKQETCRNGNNTDLPEITLFITAYNEEQVVDGKMKNCQELDYPKEKLHIVWVTDGSNDRTNEKLKANVKNPPSKNYQRIPMSPYCSSPKEKEKQPL